MQLGVVSVLKSLAPNVPLIVSDCLRLSCQRELESADVCVTLRLCWRMTEASPTIGRGGVTLDGYAPVHDLLSAICHDCGPHRNVPVQGNVDYRELPSSTLSFCIFCVFSIVNLPYFYQFKGHFMALFLLLFKKNMYILGAASHLFSIFSHFQCFLLD
jgi:hypothetical protein